jgi:hypothetical protein
MPPSLGKLLILLGLLLLGFGLLINFLPFGKLGRLPGDISITLRNGRIHIPLTTCLLISLVLSLALWVISLFRR